LTEEGHRKATRISGYRAREFLFFLISWSPGNLHFDSLVLVKQNPCQYLMPTLSLLFNRFLKLGATAYGGPAMSGQIKQAVVTDYGWIREQEFLQGIALCQLIPGATNVQLVTYVGYRLRGIWGAILSAIAFTLPAFIFMVILSAIYFKVQTLWFIEALFKGLGAIVVAIVLNACINLGRSILRDWKVILISFLSFFAFFFRWNVILIFILAALAALFLHPKRGKLEPPSHHEELKLTKKKGEGYFIIGMLIILVYLGLILCYLINPQLAYLSLTLSKIGALAFGGGFTMVPLIQYEVVDYFQWLTTKEFLDGIALGQVTPGPIMITATFIGYKLSGLFGALIATVGIFSSSFFILILLIPHYDRLRRIEIVKTMEQGILGSFIGMICLVLYNFGKAAFVDVPSILFAGAAFFAILKKIDLLYILISGTILSILIFGFLN
jgi:chromate transporter